MKKESHHWPEWLETSDTDLLKALSDYSITNDRDYESFRYIGPSETVEQLDKKRFIYLCETINRYNPIKLLSLAPLWVRSVRTHDFLTSVRFKNIMLDNNIETVGGLLEFSNHGLLEFRNMGKKSLLDFFDSTIQLAANKPTNLDYEIPNSITRKQSRWHKSILTEIPELDIVFAEKMIVDESSYLEKRSLLAENLTHQIDDYRYNLLFSETDTSNPIDLLNISHAWLLDMDIKYFMTSPRIKNVIISHHIRCLRDFLKFDLYTLSRLKNMGGKSIKILVENIHSARKKGPPPTFENPVVSNLTLYEHLENTLLKLKDDKHKFVIENRIGFRESHKTLEEIASVLDLTRERVRQIQNKVATNIIDDEFWADSLKFILLSLYKKKRTPIYLENLVKSDPWFLGFEDKINLLKKVIEVFSNLDFHFLDLNEGIVLTTLSRDDWSGVKNDVLNFLEHSLDMNYNFDDIELIIENQLSYFNAEELSENLFNELVSVLNFSTSDGESILTSIGNTISSRLSVILEEADYPLHFSYIRHRYEEKYGIFTTDQKIHAALTYNKYWLFNRGVFGNAQHLPLTLDKLSELSKLATEFASMDTGKQWHVSELLKKLRQSQAVNENNAIDKYVLNIGLKEFSSLHYLGKMIWVVKNIENLDTSRIHLKEALAIILRDSGGPMSVKAMETELQKTRGTGFDITQNLYGSNLFAKTNPGMWGLLSRDFEKSVTYWDDVLGELLVHLNTSRMALHKSELLNILSTKNILELPKLNLLLGVISVDDNFKTWKGNFIGLSSWEKPNRLSLSNVVITALESFENTIKIDELQNVVGEKISYPYNQSQISHILNEIGLSYDSDNRVWLKSQSDDYVT